MLEFPCTVQIWYPYVLFMFLCLFTVVSCDEELIIDMINQQMDLIAATYSAAQLDACITNKTLLDSLSLLGSLAFADDQLQVLKDRLDMVRSGQTLSMTALFLLMMYGCLSFQLLKKASTKGYLYRK